MTSPALTENVLRRTARTWETWAQRVPYFSILPEPKAVRGKWNLDEFFQTGLEEIILFFAHCKEVRVELPETRHRSGFWLWRRTLVARTRDSMLRFRDRSRHISTNDRVGERAQSGFAVSVRDKSIHRFEICPK